MPIQPLWSRVRYCLVILGVTCSGFDADGVSAQSITEFPLPANSQPALITTGPDGYLWFALQTAIGRADTSGGINLIPLSLLDGYPYATGIAAGPDGNVWFTEESTNKIGRITTAGVITEFPVPTASGSPSRIVAGPDNSLWFTEAGGNKIGRSTTSGVITEFPVPTAGSSPTGISAGPDGNLWFTEWTANKIGRITTSGVITEFPIPTAASHPVGICVGPDGSMWFTESTADKIGRITLTGTINELPITATSHPAEITTGPDGNLWFAASGTNKIVRLTPAGVATEFPVPLHLSTVPPFTAVAAPAGIAVGPDGNIWYLAVASAQLGRLTLLPGFYSVAPCRVLDTRNPAGPFGGPPLAAGADRIFTIPGQCGIPTTASAVSANVTITNPIDSGDLRLYPAATSLPLVSSINYRPGQTRANNTIAPLGAGGGLTVHCDQSTGTVHLILDVNGYFR